MRSEPTSGGRLRFLLAALAVLFAAAAWLRWGGGDGRALAIVRAHIEPGIDPEHPLGEVFDRHPRLPGASWHAQWGGDRRCAAVTLRAAALAEVDAACPGLLAPLRGLVARDPRWAGLAPDQPLAIEIVFRVAAGDEPRVEAFQVLATEAWVVFKPEQVAAYEAGLEESIRHSDDTGLARRYRLRHDGERAFFDVGLNAPLLAGAGMEPPLAVARRIAAWR